MSTRDRPGLVDFSALIQAAERRDLDLIPVVNVRTPPPTLAGRVSFVRVKGIARSLPSRKAEFERFLIEDVITGLHGLKAAFVYLILGDATSIGVYLGVREEGVSLTSSKSSDAAAILCSTLQGTYPDIELETLSDEVVDHRLLGAISFGRHFGTMTGIPTPKLGTEQYGVEQIERILRGIYRESFGYLVVAAPVGEQDAVVVFDDVTTRIRELSGLVKETHQRSEPHRGLSVSTESLNRQAQYGVEVLEATLERLKLGKAEGLWRTQTYYFTIDPLAFAKLGNLLKVVFSGDKSFPEPIRTTRLSGSPAAAVAGFRELDIMLDYAPLGISGVHPLERLMERKYSTVLNTRELATLCHLPKEEMPGYNVKDSARFGVHPPERRAGPSLSIGDIMDRGLSTGNACVVPTSDLTKHGLIAGVTGSGKTNTVFNLLDQLWTTHRTPFLVVEPAKSEYRALKQLDALSDLQVFTLGDETTAPFRLNPFEIMPGVRVQSHIDYLRAAFNASFVMYAPMPHVLERCIHEIYEDAGWDLIASVNRHQAGGTIGIHPTLTDLYEKIDSVVDRLGYEDKITMDVKAALKTRIGSLRIGGKGAMLDTVTSIPMDVLLSSPTVLELNRIGDDEEKAFIIGLLLARLYEFLEANRDRGHFSSGLRHLTVVEEAHRLLTKAPSDTGNPETVNTKGKAVESFCNLLSEIRAFGEGMLIAEQIPSKLALDAIKNSSLKVVHRLVAQDDRELVGSTMNLNPDQTRYLALLKPGAAAVFLEGADEPYLVGVPYFPDLVKLKPEAVTAPLDEKLARMMATRVADMGAVYGKQPGCELCKSKCRHFDIVRQVLDKGTVSQQFSYYVLGVIGDKQALAGNYETLRDVVLAGTPPDHTLQPEEAEGRLLCFLITAGNRFLRERQNQYGLERQALVDLLDGYFGILRPWFAVKVKTTLSTETESAVEQFRATYRSALTCEYRPLTYCDDLCQDKCLFRYEVRPYAGNLGLDRPFEQLQRGESTPEEHYRFCLKVARSISPMSGSPELLEGIARCFFVQQAERLATSDVTDLARDVFGTRDTTRGEADETG